LGLETHIIRSYPDEILLEEVRRVAQLVDKPVLTTLDFEKHAGIASKTLRQRFGSWRAVLEQAGLGHMYIGADDERVRLYRARYSDEYLLEEVRRVAGAAGKPVLTTTEFERHSRVSVETLANRFGGWHDVLKRAGIGHMCFGTAERSAQSARPRLTDDYLLEEVRRIAGIVGKPWLSHPDFCKHSKINPLTLNKRFGAWDVVLKRAGLGHMYIGNVEGYKRPRAIKHSNGYLLEEIRRVAGLVEKPELSMSDFKKHSRAGLTTLRRRLGTWRDALDLAGLGHMFRKVGTEPNGGYSDEALLEEVKRVAQLVGKPVLTAKDFENHAQVSLRTLVLHFESWRAALERAGLSHMFSGWPVGGYSDETLLEEVRRMAHLVEKPVLTKCDFRMHSRISDVTVMKRFGGWRNALHHAGVGHMCSPEAVVGSRSQAVSSGNGHKRERPT